jgi:Zn-dependent peptidase ImmA (M78 family)
VVLGTGLMTRPDQATKDASDMLARLWPNEGGSVVVPVDVVRIARKLGIDVVEVEMERGISGAIVKDPGADPMIILNQGDSRNRKRFTCAHELGHYVRRTQEGASEYAYLDRRGPLAAAGTDEAEIYANKFAASLLMPDPEIRRRFKKDATVATLAVDFLVSEDAMNFRLQNLGLMSTGKSL